MGGGEKCAIHPVTKRALIRQPACYNRPTIAVPLYGNIQQLFGFLCLLCYVRCAVSRYICVEMFENA